MRQKLIEGLAMPVDLHFICKRGEKFKRIVENLFQTGDWTATDELADLAVGGRVFLHHAQRERAWHGGTIESWKAAPAPDMERKIFIYRAEFDYKQHCKATWARQRAIARWNTGRTTLLKDSDYLQMLKSKTDHSV
jgi:hypothetical protein